MFLCVDKLLVVLRVINRCYVVVSWCGNGLKRKFKLIRLKYVVNKLFVLCFNSVYSVYVLRGICKYLVVFDIFKVRILEWLRFLSSIKDMEVILLVYFCELYGFCFDDFFL